LRDNHQLILYHFQHTTYLYALAAVPLLGLLYMGLLGWKRRTMRRVGDAALVRTLLQGYRPGLFALKYFLVVAALALAVLGVANLRKPGGKDNISRKGLDVMIALDVSKSMLAEDLKPNRLERAKQLVIKLMEQLKNDRVGLVLFAGRAYLQMPLTTDHAAARMYVSTSNPSSVPTQGTVIGEALKLCGAAFNSKERKYKAVVLISDGEDHDESALPIAQQLAETGAMVNTVGLGSPQGAPIMDKETGTLKTDDQGNTVISKLNEEGLKAIAAATQGRYLRLDATDDAVKTLVQQIGSMEQRVFSDNSFINYQTRYQWFVLAALVLLLTELLIPERKLVLS
jgi:Ca-activated chloride channel family protein